VRIDATWHNVLTSSIDYSHTFWRSKILANSFNQSTADKNIRLELAALDERLLGSRTICIRREITREK
jgi:hypothetical protein